MINSRNLIYTNILDLTNLNSHGDHRLGMLAAVAALRSTTPLFLIDPDAVAVSYPSFFADLAKLGGA